MLQKIANGIDAFNDWIGRSVSWLTLAMVLVTFLVVVLRYVFNLGWIWMQESVTYMHGIVFMIAGGYSLLHDQHVRIDVIYRPMKARGKALVNIFGTLFLLFPTCYLIIFYAYPYVEDSWSVFEGSKEAGGLPGLFLLKTVILVFAALIGLQGIAHLLRNILTLIDPEHAQISEEEETHAI